MGDGTRILLFALLSALNPTLLAAVTIMLLLPNPKRLMLGYLLGAYLTTITIGLLVVFELHDAAAVATTKRTLSPSGDLALGALLVLAGVVLRGRRLQARRERRQARREAEGPQRRSLPERLLGRGDPRIAFFVGVILSFPGASYLAALTQTSKLDVAAPWLVLIVLGVCVVQQALLEGPIVAYALWPEPARRAIAGLREWLARSGRRVAANVAISLGLLLLLRGAIALIAAG